MKYIYGLSVSGQSIIKYFFTNKVFFIAWDDDEKIRKKVKKIYNDIKFVHPKDLDWSKVTEAFVSPGIDLKIKSYMDITSPLTVAKILVGNLSKIEDSLFSLLAIKFFENINMKMKYITDLKKLAIFGKKKL